MRDLLKSLLLALLLTFVCADAVSVHAASDYRIVFEDEEDLLSDGEEAALKQDMEGILAYGNAGFITVSQYENTSSYAKAKYRELFGHDSGILFVIDMGRRNIWIYCDGKIYRSIDKAYSNTITDNVYRYASRGEYYQCAKKVFEQALTLLQGGRIAQPMKYISNFLIACVSALLINFFILTIQRKDDEDIIYNAPPALTTLVGVSILSKKITASRSRKHVESSSSSGGGGGGFSGGGGGGGGGSSGGGGGHSF